MNEDIQEVTEEELEAMDETLFQMEMLYKSRCVRMPGTNNVVVNEIPENKDQ